MCDRESARQGDVTGCEGLSQQERTKYVSATTVARGGKNGQYSCIHGMENRTEATWVSCGSWRTIHVKPFRNARLGEWPALHHSQAAQIGRKVLDQSDRDLGRAKTWVAVIRRSGSRIPVHLTVRFLGL